jgi:hypothetical protein
MQPKVLLIPAALCAATTAVWLAASDEPEAGAPSAQPEHVQQAQAPAPPASVAPSQPAVAPASAGREEVARWVTESASDDARTRIAAIIALARAPKAVALPALHRTFEGSSADEQQIALSSLYTIAIEQGDDDGRIRDAIRGAIYHGGDDNVSGNAQALLEDIEAAIAAQGR